MIQKLLWILILSIIPLFSLYASEKTLIVYEDPVQISIAQFIANDLYLALDKKIEIALIQTLPSQSINSGYSSIIRLEKVNTEYKITYENLLSQQKKEWIQNPKKELRKFIYETIESLTEKEVPKIQRKMDIYYQYNNKEDIIKIKEIFQSQSAQSLREKFNTLSKIANQENLFIQLSTQSLNQYIQKKSNVLNQTQEKETLVKLKMIEVLLIEQIIKNLKQTNHMVISEKSNQKEILSIKKSEIYDVIIAFTLNLKASDSNLLIRADAIDLDLKIFQLYSKNTNLNQLEDININQIASQINQEIQNKYPVRPLESGATFKDITQSVRMTQNKYDTLREQKEIEKRKKEEVAAQEKLFSIYGGIVWNQPKIYSFSSALDQKTNSFFGLSFMSTWKYNDYFSFLGKFQYFPFKQKTKIIDIYSIDYGNVEITHMMDFIIGANAHIPFHSFKIGATIQPGFNTARIEIKPNDPAVWAGKDTKGYFFSGLKLQAGLFFETNLLIPVYLELLYQFGTTEGIKHNGFAANFMIKIISF